MLRMLSLHTTARILITSIRQKYSEFQQRFVSTMGIPRSIAAELVKIRREKAEKNSSLINNAYIQIVGSNCHGFMPSILVNSEQKSYLFNCSAGFQRLSYSSKIKLLNLNNVFITNTDWNNIAGLFGLSLTLQDAGCHSLELCGGDGIKDFYDSAKTFMTFTSGIKIATRTHLDGVYQDSGLKICPIAIVNELSRADSENEDDANLRKKSKQQVKLLTYACRLPDLPGQLNAQKCRELKVPIGPKLGLLKNGQDVTLDDGRQIKSSDVCGKPDLGYHFVVLECPTVELIDSFINNTELSRLSQMRFSQNEREVDLLIHFSPAGVTSHPRYLKWLDSFSERCKHWFIVHKNPTSTNFIDCYRMMYMMRKVDEEIFPNLYNPESLNELISEELKETQNIKSNSAAIEENINAIPVTEVAYDDTTRVMAPNAFDRIVIRPKKSVEIASKKFYMDSYLRIAEMNEYFNSEYRKLKKSQEIMNKPQEFEPEIVFLGTGSAVPSKLRNTSCVLVNLFAPEDVSVILDCGEDSFGQMLRHYGPEMTRNILGRVKMIYVSHHHPDHHIGLLRLIRERRSLTDEPVILLLPPGVDRLLEYHNENYEDLKDCYTIFSTKNLKERTSEQHSNHNVRSQKSELLKLTGGLLRDISIVGVDHCIHACAAVFTFNISRPGMKTFKLAYSGDARPSQNFITIGQDCDLLIHEATFDHRGRQDALSKKHSTTSEAIDVGRRMKAKFTILTHYSQRFAKIPYFTDEFDDKVGFAFDNLTLRCPSQFDRLPAMKDLLKVIFERSLQEIDVRYQRKDLKMKTIDNLLEGLSK